jgi:hypothetical protein
VPVLRRGAATLHRTIEPLVFEVEETLLHWQKPADM